MRTESVSASRIGWLALAVAAATLAAACSGADLAREGSSPPVELVQSAPAGCEKIGDIRGSDEVEPQLTPSQEAAQADALRQARKKGATHVVKTYAGRCWRYTECYEVTAYRCPAPPGPVPGY